MQEIPIIKDIIRKGFLLDCDKIIQTNKDLFLVYGNGKASLQLWYKIKVYHDYDSIIYTIFDNENNQLTEVYTFNTKPQSNIYKLIK